MLKSLKVVRLATGAAAALLGGFASPAWATYGGEPATAALPHPSWQPSVMSSAWRLR